MISGECFENMWLYMEYIRKYSLYGIYIANSSWH